MNEFFGQLVAQHIEPRLRNRNCYIVSSDTAEQISPHFACGTSCSAWTSRVLDLGLAQFLVSRGQWQGRSFAAVIDFPQHRTARELAGSVVHELAHWLDTCADMSAVSDPVTQSAEVLSWYEQALNGVPTVKRTKQVSWYAHGSRFVRAACHGAYRAKQSLPGFDVSDVRFACYYPGSTEHQFYKTLQSEIVTRERESIRDIIDSPVPKAFSELWSKLTGRRVQQPSIVRSNERA